MLTAAFEGWRVATENLDDSIDFGRNLPQKAEISPEIAGNRAKSTLKSVDFARNACW